MQYTMECLDFKYLKPGNKMLLFDGLILFYMPIQSAVILHFTYWPMYSNPSALYALYCHILLNTLATLVPLYLLD